MRRALSLAAGVGILTIALGCTAILGVTDVPNPIDAGGAPDARRGADGAGGCEAGESRCSGACVDTSTSKAHCGSCGATCEGTCTDGHCLVVLAKGQGDVCSIAVGEGAVYWAGGQAVASEPVTGGPVAIVAKRQDYPNGIALGASDLVWGAGFGDRIEAYSLTSRATRELASGLNGTGGIALDATHVYLTTMTDVLRVPLGGGSVETLATDQQQPFGIALDGAYVYWTNTASGDTGSIVRAPKSPGAGAALTLASALDVPTGIAVHSGYVYWTNAGLTTAMDGSVVRVPTSGGKAETIASAQNDPQGIAVDDTSVYWACDIEATLRKAPLAGGPSTVIASGLVTVCAVALDETYVYFSTEFGVVGRVTKN